MRANYDVIMLVANAIESDSRVIRTARTVSAADLSLLVIGLGPASPDGGEPRVLTIPGLEAVLVSAPKLSSAVPGSVEHAARHRTLLRHYEEGVLAICGEMSPRIVHSHDMTGLPAGARLQSHFAARGLPVRWIHDIHEWVGGLTTIAESIRQVSLDDEREHIRQPDALTTVSPAIADIIRTEYALESRPTVILNTPGEREFDPHFEPTVRDVLGLSPDAPLAVYSGQVKEARGVHDIVASLAHLPELHVALVSNNRGAYLESLRQQAATDGTSGRLHFVPYVAQDKVAAYLRSADVGVHPLSRYGNGDVALPNKLFEYLHAGLPVVVSDCAAMAAFVNENGVGRVYPAGDPMRLATELRAALDARPQLVEHVARARATYTWERQERLIHDIYAELLGVGQIASTRPFTWSAQPVPSDTGMTAPLRVFHGVAGSAGQPWTIASALRKRGHFAHNVVTSLPRLGFQASLLAPWRRLSSGEQFELIRDLAADFDVWHFHARSFFFERGSLRFPSLLDLLLLRLMGKVVIFHFRGTEARIASQFARANPYNYVDSDPYGFSESFPEPVQVRMLAYIAAVSSATFVTDPELQSYVPEAEIVPRAIDLDDWRAVGTSSTQRPLLVHAPTRTEVKGTPHVLAAVDALRGEGHSFDFALAQDIPHAEARALYERADIIIDQLRIGWYGVVAVEGMALGKAVVSYIRPDLLGHLGTPLPLAAADPTNVTDVLRRLITDADERRSLGEHARRFAERVHSSDAVAAMLEDRYRSLLATEHERGADYDGIAAFFELQAEHAGNAVTAMRRASRLLVAAESKLADADPRAKYSVAESDASVPNRQAAPDLRAVLGAHRQVSAALSALDDVLQTPSDAGTDRGSAPSIRPTAPEPPSSTTVAPAVPDGPARTGPPSVREVADAERWGIGQMLRKLANDDTSNWEAVGAASVREPTLGLAMIDQLLRHRAESDRDAVAMHLAIGAARAFDRQDDRLYARPRDLDSFDQSPVDVKHQVRFARHFHNLRSVLGYDAAQISTALLRAVLHDVDPERPTPFANAEDDGTRLNDLSWFFINTARLREGLDGIDRDLYERSLAWFASRTHLWSVEAWKTTRASLSANLPIRWTLRSGPNESLGDMVVRARRDEPLDTVRRFDPATGTLDAVETVLRTSIDHIDRIELEVAASQPLQVLMALPRYRFDPLRSTPMVERWESGPELTIAGDSATATVEIPPDQLTETPTVTAFTIVEGHYVSRTLDRQIEQMRTLDELHPGRGFAARAEQWEGFRDAWAARPAR